jgi:hypothetical protein
MSTWIPALHAGMTQWRALLKLTETPASLRFKEAHEGHEKKISRAKTQGSKIRNPNIETCPEPCRRARNKR